MKKRFFHLAMLAFAFGFSSCEKEEVYSCDKETNLWVKENIDEVRSMTRSSWLSLDKNTSVKRAVYIAFSPDMQKQFWEDKITEVIKEFTWNEKETNHLILFLNYIKESDIFHQNDIDDHFEVFVYKWHEYALNELGWTQKLIYAITATGDKLLNKKGDIINSAKNETIHNRIKRNAKEDGGYSDCSCSQKSDWCDLFKEIPGWVLSCNSYSYKCKKVDGCGTLWRYPCDGICKSPIA